MQPQANRERIIIRTSLSAGVPNVVADLRSLRQILLNLLSNAIKFTRSGGQVIVATALEDSGEVVLRIRDTGIGMTANDIDTAMKPFRQVSTPGRPRRRAPALACRSPRRWSRPTARPSPSTASPTRGRSSASPSRRRGCLQADRISRRACGIFHSVASCYQEQSRRVRHIWRAGNLNRGGHDGRPYQEGTGRDCHARRGGLRLQHGLSRRVARRSSPQPRWRGPPPTPRSSSVRTGR